MIRYLLYPVLLLNGLLTVLMAGAQEDKKNTRLFRIYEDNDGINILGNGSDDGYTNGTRLDLFYVRLQKSYSLINAILPRAGDSSINTYGWSAMQVMITPKNLRRIVPDPADYPYSGALFVTHSLHSSNPQKKILLQSSWLIGIRGPEALAKELQQLIHRMLDFQYPRGWASQKPTALLLNYHFTYEKQLAQYGSAIDVIGHAEAFAGTLMNGAALYGLVRVGKMNPYFNGYLQQFTSGSKKNKAWQLYMIFQPGIELMIGNALLNDGLFTKTVITSGNSNDPKNQTVSNRFITHLNAGVVLSKGNVGISFLQKHSSPVIRGLKSHLVGNVSLYLAW